MRDKKLLRWTTVAWALVAGAAFVALGASVILPSTKRASPDMRRILERAATQPTTQPATNPATQPTTRP